MSNRMTLTALLALLLAVPLGARGPDPDNGGSRAQERLDRDTQRAAERAAEQSQRFAEERARVEERAARDPAKAAEDMAKLEADAVKEQDKAREDAAKAENDFEKESAKEAADAAEDASHVDGDNSSHGSSETIADLGQSEDAEHDGRGFAVRRGEVVAIDLSPAAITAAQSRGFKVIERHRLTSLDHEVVRLAVPGQTDAASARAALAALDPKATVDLVHYYGLGLAAGEAGKPVRGRPSLARTGRGDGLTIGVIDTAIARHAALGQSRIVAWSAGDLATAPRDHGTAVASLLTGEGRTTIYSANIFRGPADRPFTSADVIADALDWMIAQGVPIINMSLAGPRNAILDSLLRDAQRRGRLIVAAAGNGGPSAPPAYPAAVPGVVAVTAVDSRNQIYRYANRGHYISVAARGVDVVAANARGGFASFTGTSFASPHVAGWLARCRSTGNSAAQCQDKLRTAARDLGAAGFDDVYGFGVID